MKLNQRGELLVITLCFLIIFSLIGLAYLFYYTQEMSMASMIDLMPKLYG